MPCFSILISHSIPELFCAALALFADLVFVLGCVPPGADPETSILKTNIWEVTPGNAGRDMGKETERGER